MKQLILSFIVFFAIVSTVFAQSHQTQKQRQQAIFDSLKDVNRLWFLASKMDSIPAMNKRLLQLAEEIKADSNYATVYNQIGNYFAVRSNFSLALEYNFKAVEAAKKGVPARLSLLYGNLANMYTGLGNYKVALYYSDKAQQYLQLDKHHGSVAVSTIIAGVYNDMGQADSALYYVQQAYQRQLKVKPHTAVEKGNFNQSMALIYRNFGRVYEQLNEPELTNYYYKKGIRFCDSVNMPRLRVSIAIYYCKYLGKGRKYGEAKNYGVLVFEAAKKNGYKQLVADAADMLYILNEKQGKADSAFCYLKMKNLYLDSLAAEEKTGQMQSLIISQQLHEAEQNAVAVHAEEQRKHNIQYAAIALGLVLMVMIFLLLSRSIIVNTRVIEIVGVIGLLIVFEFINLVIHPYLADLTNDSPILMLLILVLIAAIIVPLHHQLEHWIKHKLVEKNKAIRLAAAKKTIEQLEGEK